MRASEPIAAAESRASSAGISPFTPIAIECKQVTKSYRLYNGPWDMFIDHLGLRRLIPWHRSQPSREFTALRSIDLTVRRGERVGIIGRNGAGKSTLLKMIIQNFRPTSGQIKVVGSVQALMTTGLGFHPELSGIENIRSALQYGHLSDRETDETIDDIIDFVELGEFLNQPVKTYSSGMRARLQFATATAIKPDILIVDEILGAGDAYFAGKSAHRMQTLAKSGCTLLLVSHSTAQVLQFCERAVWLEQGRIVRDGEALEVVKAYEQFIAGMRQKQAWAQEQKAQESRNASVNRARDFETPTWQKDHLLQLLETADPATGQKQDAPSQWSRWLSEPGLKISRITLLDGNGRAVDEIGSGDPLDIEIRFRAEHDGRFTARFTILLMTLAGIPLVRHLSDPFSFDLSAGQEAAVRLRYCETLLASGEFVYSAAIFKHYDPENSTTAVRYDLVSRSMRLKVRPRVRSEPGCFRHPCQWLPVEKTIEPLLSGHPPRA